MANGVDDNLIAADFVKDKVWVRCDGQTTNAQVICADTDKGVKR